MTLLWICLLWILIYPRRSSNNILSSHLITQQFPYQMPLKAIASTNVIIEGSCIPATIIYSSDSGKIVDIVINEVLDIQDGKKSLLSRYDIQDCENVSPRVILPGLVDSHVHLNEPGRTEWEGFETGTKAAISGGVTTIVDMPLNAIPPTTTVKNFNLKLNAAKNQLWCDVAFWGGLVPTNLDDLIPLIQAGVRGFKGFLSHSGVDEFPQIDKDYIDNAMRLLKKENTMLLFHSELDDGEERITRKSDFTDYKTFMNSRPPTFETDAIDMIIGCTKENLKSNQDSSLKVHIVHLATGEGIPLIKDAHANGLPITAETCFHYLSFSENQVEDKATHYKCCPPIRHEENRLALWEGIQSGAITSVVSDHSPCTPELKNLQKGDFIKAWGGISSVGFNLPVMYTFGSKLDNPMTLPEIVKLCCENTAKQAGLNDRKGHIKLGYDADFVIFNREREQFIENHNVQFKNKLTPYDGLLLHGVVEKTILRGQDLFTIDNGVNKEPLGSALLESRCN